MKLRGFRIELGEIEAVLGEHPQVEACALALREDAGEKRLVGYVVWGGERAGDLRSLREWLKQKLPEYMLPSAWVELERLPLTPNGKLDRSGLPAPRRVGGAGAQAPQTALERALAGLWAEALGVEAVGAGDNFFELGGHSLLAIRLMSRIQELFQVEAPLRLFYEAADLSAFAAGLRSAAGKIDLEKVAGLILHLARAAG